MRNDNTHYNPNLCPNCGSEDSTGHQASFDSNYAWRSITCDTCDAEWRDLYTLTGYEAIGSSDE